MECHSVTPATQPSCHSSHTALRATPPIVKRRTNPTISRAEGGRLQCHVRRPETPSGLPPACDDHTSSVPTPPQRAFGRNHAPLVSRLHNGRRTEPRASGTTPGTTSLARSHAQHTITPRHHEQSAQRASVPRPAPRAISTTGLRTTPAQRAFRTTGLRTTPAQRASARLSWHNAPSGCPIRHIQNEKGMTIALPRVPNGLAFSCRERVAQTDFKKGPIARAKRSVATPCSALRPPSVVCHPHAPTTPAQDYTRHDGRSVTITPIGDTPSTTGRDRNHTHRGSRFPTTSAPHHERAYHTWHHELSAPRACVPHLAPRAPARRS